MKLHTIAIIGLCLISCVFGIVLIYMTLDSQPINEKEIANKTFIMYQNKWTGDEICNTGISPFVETTDEYVLIGLEVRF